MNTNPQRLPLLLGVYQRYLVHQDSGRFVSEVSNRYAIGGVPAFGDPSDPRDSPGGGAGHRFLGRL